MKAFQQSSSLATLMSIQNDRHDKNKTTHTGEKCQTSVTCPAIKVLIVDDDAVADVGVVQAVSEGM